MVKSIIAFLVLFCIAYALLGMAFGVGPTVPSNILYYLPINVMNQQSIAVAANTPIAIGVSPQGTSASNIIGFNAFKYSQYYTCNLNNAEFFFANGTVADSWLEGNFINESSTNSICTSSSSQNALVASSNVLYWVKIPGNAFLTANTGTPAFNTIYLGWAGNVISAVNDLFSNTITGEAPQLTCTPNANLSYGSCTSYGKYDNGGSVFNNYWNFNGTALPSTFTKALGNSASNVLVDNGLYMADNSYEGIAVNTPITNGNQLTGLDYETFGFLSCVSTSWCNDFQYIAGNGVVSTSQFVPSNGLRNNGGLPTTSFIEMFENTPYVISFTNTHGQNKQTITSVDWQANQAASERERVGLSIYSRSGFTTNTGISNSASQLGLSMPYTNLNGNQILNTTWMRTRIAPPSDVLPNTTFGAISEAKNGVVSITAHNTIATSLQKILFTASASGGSGSYTYNFIVFNAISNTIMANQLGSLSSFLVQTNSLWVSNSPVIANVIVTDTGVSPNYDFNSVNSANVTISLLTTVPQNVLYYIPIIVANYQTTAVAANTPIAIGVTRANQIYGTNGLGFNALAYQQYYTCNLNNAEFFFANGTVATSWLEGNMLNELNANSACTSASSPNALVDSSNIIYWLLDPSQYFLPANTGTPSSNTVYLGWTGNVLTSANNLLSNTLTGEAPQLSCPNPYNTNTCYYGEYDNGNNIFNPYYNFIGNALPSSLSLSAANNNEGNVVVYNGLVINQNDPTSSHGFIGNIFGNSNGIALDALVNQSQNLYPKTGGGNLALGNTVYLIGPKQRLEPYNGMYSLFGLAGIALYWCSPITNCIFYGYNVRPPYYIAFAQGPVIQSLQWFGNNGIQFTSLNQSADSQWVGIFGSNTMAGEQTTNSFGYIVNYQYTAQPEYAFLNITWIRGRQTTYSGVLPNTTYGSVTLATPPYSQPSNPSLTLSNTMIDQGQPILFTASVQNGNDLFNYKYVVYNSITNVPVYTQQYNDVASRSNTLLWTPNPNFYTGNTFAANVVISEFGAYSNTVNTIGTPFGYNSAPIITIQSVSNTLLDSGQYTTFTLKDTGGTGPVFNVELYNITGSNQQGSNILILSVGGTNTIAIKSFSQINGNVFNFNAIGYDEGITTPFTNNSAIVSITVNVPISATLFASNSEIISGQVTKLTSQPSGGTLPYSYQWYANYGSSVSCSGTGNALSGATANTYVANPTTTNSYDVKVTDSATIPENKCLFIGTTVTVYSVPSIALAVQNTLIDLNQYLTAIASVSGGSGTYSSTYNFIISNSIVPSITVANQLAATNAISLQTNSLWVSNSPLQLNVTAEDTGVTTPFYFNSIKDIYVNSMLAVGINPISGNMQITHPETWIATVTPGQPPYTYNWNIYNSLGLVGNGLYAGVTSSTNSFSFTCAATGTYVANTFVTDSASVPESANTINSIINCITSTTSTSTTSTSTTIAASGGGGSSGGGYCRDYPICNYSGISTSISTSTSTTSTSTSSSTSSTTVTTTIKNSNTTTIPQVTEHINLTRQTSVNFNNTNTTVIISSTAPHGNATLTIQNITKAKIIAPPKNFTQLVLLNLTLKTNNPLVNIRFSTGYPCSINSSQVAPYRYSNGTWNQILPFVASSQTCKVSFTVTNSSLIGIFYSRPIAPPPSAKSSYPSLWAAIVAILLIVLVIIGLDDIAGRQRFRSIIKQKKMHPDISELVEED